MLDAFLNGVENQESPQEPSALAITNLASTVLESRSSSVAGSVNERPASIISSLPPRSNPSPAASNTDVGDEGREKRQCPWPDCGRSFKDLKAHMLTHQDERPEKCPIVNCEYHIKGFARKNDRNRHTLTHYKGQMVCGFCPNAGLAAEKIFNRADVFKRHLISIHGVGQTEFNYRKRSPISSSMEQQKPLPGYSEDATGKCSTCSTTFSNAQDFYEHLDDCILRAVQQEEPSEAINQKRLAEVANDEDVKLTLEKHNLLYTGFTDDGGIFEGADYGAVKMLIEKGAAAYNKTSGDGSTLLSLAARRGDEAVVKVLIEKGAIVDSVDTPYGRTPLSWAAENGHDGVVKLLIEKGAAVDSVDKTGLTPLSWAAQRGHEAVVKVLIEKGAAVDSVDTNSQTPLSWAAENGHDGVVKVLIEKGAAVDLVDTNGRTPLSWAARGGHEAVVKVLIEKGAAAVDSVDTLHGQTPLSWAARRGHEAVVKVLIEKGAAVDSVDTPYGRTPLLWAAENGHEAVAKVLIEKGTAVDLVDTNGLTPLSWAARRGHEAVVKVLIEKGATVDSVDTNGQTPLSWAAENGHEAVAKVLIEKGAAVSWAVVN
ncbi:hypothetical protein EIK77_004327 [Talaromyces pinophilus]|nr:hypothetical protein EIK77_004327 [Talaromyces pinophilus]